MIHNPELLRRYESQREQFESESASGSTQEGWAFHGCPDNAVQAIIHGGFRPGHEVGIQNGNAYGQGE